MRRVTLNGKVSGLALVAGIALMPFGAAAAAQPAEQDQPAQQERTVGVEEIIITAQRFEENLQDVPIAVSAFGSEELREGRITSVRDIAQLTPSFTHSEVNPGEPTFAIRGIGTEGISSNAGGDASVVMFIDGVYIGRGGGANLELYDLERVEVLRGPQGTLFGKNVVGGAISIITRRPDFHENSVAGSITLGNHDRLELLTRINTAVSDTIALSGAATWVRRDGYSYNATTGNDVDDEDVLGVRVAARFAPSPDVDLVLAADYTRQSQRGQPRDNVCDTTFNNGVHCVGVDPDPRVVNSVDDGYLDRDVGGLMATATIQTGVGELTSITAFRAADYAHRDAFFSNPVNPPTQIESINENIEQSQQFSQEVRLASTMLSDRLRSVIGLYYLSENIERTEYLQQIFPAPAQQGSNAFPQDVDSESFALFGQLNFDLLQNLTVTAGARMTWESKDAHLQGLRLAGPGWPPPLAEEFDVTASESWSAFTPRFAIAYHPTERIMLYASAAKGFKSGGFQGTPGTAASAAIPYNPEYAWSYEGGIKSRFLDNRVQLNLAAFHTDYTDLQVSQLVPLCCVVIGNAADARIRGFEAELTAVPTPGLRFDASYSHLDAKFSNFATGATADYTGNVLPRSPKHQLSLAAQYETALTDRLDMTARLGWSYQSKIFFEASNTPLEIQEGYSLLDARVAVAAADGRWEFAVWGRNLTDELVKNHIVAFAPFRQELNTYQPPRTFGATLSFNFR